LRACTHLFFCGAAGLLSCSSPSSSPQCSSVTIDRFKELAIVDDAVVGSPQASNLNDGPWSFRNAVENMAPEGSDPGSFVLQWFEEWGTLQTLNGYPLDAVYSGQESSNERSGMTPLILCPWEQATASNGCNSDCSTCTANPPTLDLAVAPFRLLAIVNRMDLRGQPEIPLTGEARLVFGLTNGPGDDPASAPQPMTLIFEYSLPTSQTPQQWASAWHALGSFASYDADYLNALESVTNGFVMRGAAPSAPNGSALAQARTNESITFWIWQLREFTIGPDGGMHSHTVRNTPSPSFNGSTELAAYIEQNVQAISDNQSLLPSYMLPGSSDEKQFSWGFPGMAEATRKAFSISTCNGCHSQDEPSIDTVFHISPYESGIDKLSPYLNNTSDPSSDELTVRAANLQLALCGQ
jgi:hypothetical protein